MSTPANADSAADATSRPDPDPAPRAADPVDRVPSGPSVDPTDRTVPATEGPVVGSDPVMAPPIRIDPVPAPPTTVDPTDGSPPPAEPRRRGLGFLRLLPGLLAAVLATGWVFRDVLLRGELPGNIGDARWTIALHEHWYRVWSGEEGIRDLHYYFPLPDTLGSSDAFLVQGQIYSVARLFGVGMVDSWLAAGIGFFLIGAIGVAVLAGQLLDHWASRVALVVLCCTAYPVITDIGHVQLYGLLSVSWMVVGLADLAAGRRVRGVVLLAVVPPLLALSSWYAMVLGVIVLGFVGLFLLILSPGRPLLRALGRIARDIWRTVLSIPGVLSILAFVGLWAAVLWVYLPSRGLLPKPGWIDVQTYSPRWSDLWNGTAGGGGLWAPLYARLPELTQANNEQARGFTPVLFVTFVIVGLALVRGALSGRVVVLPTATPDSTPAATAPGNEPASQSVSAAVPAAVAVTEPETAPTRGRAQVTVGRGGLLAAVLAVFATLALLLIDERGLSFYRFIWFHVPGMESVRAPYRVTVILFGLAFFVILRGAELTWNRLRVRPIAVRGLYLLLVSALVVLLFAESQRKVDADWTRADLLSPGLQAQVATAQQNCDAVILLDENPDDPGWVNPIEAVVFATVSGLATPQGYSRADPLDYPGSTGTDGGRPLADWMRQEGFTGRVCTVTSQGVNVVAGS